MNRIEDSIISVLTAAGITSRRGAMDDQPGESGIVVMADAPETIENGEETDWQYTCRVIAYQHRDTDPDKEKISQAGRKTDKALRAQNWESIDGIWGGYIAGWDLSEDGLFLVNTCSLVLIVDSGVYNEEPTT